MMAGNNKIQSTAKTTGVQSSPFIILPFSVITYLLATYDVTAFATPAPSTSPSSSCPLSSERQKDVGLGKRNALVGYGGTCDSHSRLSAKTNKLGRLFRVASSLRMGSHRRRIVNPRYNLPPLAASASIDNNDNDGNNETPISTIGTSILQDDETMQQSVPPQGFNIADNPLYDDDVLALIVETETDSEVVASVVDEGRSTADKAITTTTTTTTITKASIASALPPPGGYDGLKEGENEAPISTSSPATSLQQQSIPPPQPTLLQLRNFALPCLALWISGPLLSLVDTAAVGLSAAPGTGAAQLGALGPATTFIDGATYLFAFLNVATTNLYAAAIARYNQIRIIQQQNSQNEQDDVAAAGVVESGQRIAGDGVARTSVRISLACGFFLLVLLLSNLGALILRTYVGNGDDTIITPAYQYVQIRAWSMPTSLLGGVLQAALLGARDSITPLIAIAYSTVVNVVGDYLCVVHWRMGIRGASLATLLAQWAGTVAMIGPARRKLFATSKELLEDSSSMAAVSPAGGDDGTITPVRVSENVSVQSYLAFALPVLTLILGKIAAFGVMTHVAASLPTKSNALAAHQIILTLFFFVSPFLEVISQTAQAFLPQYFAVQRGTGNHDVEKEWDHEAGVLSSRLLRIGCVLGSVMACVAGSVPKFFPGLLTNDAGVQKAVMPLALPLAVGSIFTAPVAVSEGVLLARRELKYLASVYAVSTALLPYVLFRVKRFQGPVFDIWSCFAAFQLFRATCFTGKLWGPRLLEWFANRLEGKKGSSEVLVNA